MRHMFRGPFPMYMVGGEINGFQLLICDPCPKDPESQLPSPNILVCMFTLNTLTCITFFTVMQRTELYVHLNQLTLLTLVWPRSYERRKNYITGIGLNFSPPEYSKEFRSYWFIYLFIYFVMHIDWFLYVVCNMPLRCRSRFTEAFGFKRLHVLIAFKVNDGVKDSRVWIQCWGVNETV